jgi:predicted dehydrogenase
VYDKGVIVSDQPEKMYQMRINYRSGDMWAPQLDNTEALRLEVREFIASIDEDRRPLTDGECGMRIVQVLEATTASMNDRGRLIELDKRVTA